MLPFSAVTSMDVENQLSVQAHAEERVRSGSDIKTAEEELQPKIQYDYIWNEGQDHFVALYNPRLIYTSSWDRRFPDAKLVNPTSLNLEDPNKTPFSLLHNGGFGYERTRPRWRLSLYGFAAYGQVWTTALLVQDPWRGEGPPPDPAPIIPATIGARFTLIFAQVQALVPIRLSRRTSLTPGIQYNAFGGANEASRGVIALTQGPGASLELEHAATEEDRLISYVGAGVIDVTFQDAQDKSTIYRAEARQSWRHYYDAHWTTEVGVGASIGGDNVNGFAVFSEGSAFLIYDNWVTLHLAPGAPPQGNDPGHGDHWQFAALAKVQPWIDLFSGDLEQRAVLGIASNYGSGRLGFRDSLSYAQVVNTPESVAQYKILLGEAALRYNFVDTFNMEIGARVGYQDFDNAIRFNTLTQVTGFAGLTWSPLPYRWNP